MKLKGETQKCSGCRCNRSLDDFSDANKEYATCCKCRDKHNKRYQNKQKDKQKNNTKNRAKMICNADDDCSESDFDSEYEDLTNTNRVIPDKLMNRVFSNKVLKRTAKSKLVGKGQYKYNIFNDDKPKKGKAKCGEDEVYLLNNTCYNLKNNAMVDSDDQSYESTDVDSLFDSEEEVDIEVDKEAVANKLLGELRKLQIKVRKINDLSINGGLGYGDVGDGIHGYLDNTTGRLVLSYDDFNYWDKNKFRLGRFR